MGREVLFINNTPVDSLIPEPLSETGWRVDVVHDAETGLRLLDGRAYDLAIVLESPDAESWRLCQKIRNLTSIPLIVISASASTDTCVRAINAGADYFMRKPFGPLEFSARVSSLLQRTSARLPLPVSS
jgi:DNA-binding response OmpR family regulator